MANRKRLLTVVVAHPDDEILSLGALLIKARDEGFRINIIWLTKGLGSKSANAQKRWGEANEVAKQFGADFESFGFDEGTFTDSELIRIIEGRLRELDPNVVVWPFGMEENQHQDHRQLHKAIINIQNRWNYQKTCWIVGQPPVDKDRNFKPNLFLQFGAHRMVELHQFMELYASESDKQFANPDFIETKCKDAYYSARFSKSAYSYAEPYMIIKGLPPKSLFWVRVVDFTQEVKKYLQGLNKKQQAEIMAVIAELDKPASRRAINPTRIDKGMYRVALTLDQTKVNIVFFRALHEHWEDLIVVNVVRGAITEEIKRDSRNRFIKWRKQVN
jgi:LmbE family N-acetylglucosaminyl deacetylase